MKYFVFFAILYLGLALIIVISFFIYEMFKIVFLGGKGVLL